MLLVFTVKLCLRVLLKLYILIINNPYKTKEGMFCLTSITGVCDLKLFTEY